MEVPNGLHIDVGLQPYPPSKFEARSDSSPARLSSGAPSDPPAAGSTAGDPPDLPRFAAAWAQVGVRYLWNAPGLNWSAFRPSCGTTVRATG